MTFPLCGWTLVGVERGLLVRVRGRRPCSEPGTVRARNGRRWLCEEHALDEAALLAGRRDRRAEWHGWRETTAERGAARGAARLPLTPGGRERTGLGSALATLRGRVR